MNTSRSPRLDLVKALWLQASGVSRGHRRSANLLLRSLSLVYAVAFASLGLQITGLLGEQGILPASNYLAEVSETLEARAWYRLPTFFWFTQSDPALVSACWLGFFASVLAALGIFQGPALLLAWVLYLSCVSVGQIFLHYQWDVLLLEAGFLAPWISSWKLSPLRGLPPREPSLAVIWLYRLLIFRLMLASGWVKLQSDSVWTNLTALDFHLWTQPLPTWTAWGLAQAPAPILALGTAFTLVVELLVPFLILMGPVGRRVAFFFFTAFQLILIGTGNFGFFNLLSISIGFSLLCNEITREKPPQTGSNCSDSETAPSDRPSPFVSFRPALRGLRYTCFLLIAVLSSASLVRAFDRTWILPYPLDAIERALSGFHMANPYGLFADMTEVRPEIIVETSRDAIHWEPVAYRWKPGELDQRPDFTWFHMPRLDWQLWFEGLNFHAQNRWYDQQQIQGLKRQFLPNRWFQNYVLRLLENSPPVARLHDSRTMLPPARFVRARVFYYRFTSPAEQQQTGRWWKRDFAETYLPPVQSRSRMEPGSPWMVR